MTYKVITRTKAFNKAGISPTEKNGTDMGWVDVGFTFTPGAYQNGWLAIASNKWIIASACQEITVTPPPIDPLVKDIVQIRFGTKQGEVITWDGAGRQYEAL